MTNTTQLTLVVNNPAWRIDEETKRIGRKGLAQARAALRSSIQTTTAAAA